MKKARDIELDRRERETGPNVALFPGVTVEHGVPPVGRSDSAAFPWLQGLPIACAIVRIDATSVDVIAGNTQFRALILQGERESRIDHAMLSRRIREMADQNIQKTEFSWLSPDSIQSRRLDITITGFEDDPAQFLIAVHDRSGEIAGQLNLRREMLSDSLTGFANRCGFDERIDEIIADSGPDSRDGPLVHFGIVIIDLARFSRINECVGSMAGDELIITAARRIRLAARKSDLLARLGGNEFGLFVRLRDDRTAQADLEDLGRRVSRAFDAPCRLSDLEIQVDCAFGAAVGEVGKDDPTDVIRRAQIALKRAKMSNRFEIYAAGADRSIRRRFSIETDLRRALERDELELYYQPFVNLNTGAIAGFEALARWHHSDHGQVKPLEFIAVAEESGLIVPLGRWALHEATRTIAGWNQIYGSPAPLRIAINLSPWQIARDDVAAAVEGALRTAHISGHQIALELTESAFIADPDGTCRMMERLKALDTKISLDDFGTGFSNLAYLQRLPIDVLKIDRSFVIGMAGDRDKRAIVDTILSLARTFGMVTTAEGVETPQLARLLASLGCNFGQGHHFSRAIGAEAAWALYCSDQSAWAA